jgi:hypothetical protein
LPTDQGTPDQDALTLEIDVLPLEAKSLPLAAASREQEREEGVEALFFGTGYFQQGCDFVSAPRIDVMNLLSLLPLHLAKEFAQISARVCVQLSVLDGHRQYTPKHRVQRPRVFLDT